MGVSRGAIWTATLLFAVAVAVGYAAIGVSLDFSNALRSLSLMMPTAMMMMLRPRFNERSLVRFVNMMELILLFGVISAVGALLTYVVAIITTGYVDATLAAIDEAMGFDWPAAYAFTATNDWFYPLSRFFYCSIFNTPLLLLATLAWTDRMARGYAFMMAFAVALAITVVVFYWFPAQGTLGFYGHRDDYLPVVNDGEIWLIEKLRGGVDTVDVSELAGVVNFPSFHAASVILFIWGAWPVRRLRWIVLVTNVLMLGATPVEGTYYLIDVIGGIAVALFSIGLLYLPVSRPFTARRITEEPALA